MSSQFRLCVFFILSLVISSMVWGNNPLVEIGFDGDTSEENQVIVIGAGFGSYPEATVSYGDIPTDNGFEGATDGRGMIIHAEPGEGLMVFTQNISTPNCALIRASVRASAPHMTLYLASVDQGESTYVSTLTPNNPASFVEKYNRIANFFVPPSTGLQALLQIINTSETEALTVYIDNFEVLELGEEQINLSIDELIAPKNQPEPTVTLIPTVTPVPTSTNTPEPTVTPTPIEEREIITIPLTGLPEGAKPLEMVYIAPGTFMMGSPEEELDRNSDEKQHQVTLTRGFYMGKYEVTQAQWEAVMGTQPSKSYGVGPNHPVYNVSWQDAAMFCNKLSQIENRTPVYTESDEWAANLYTIGYRLPTEAEWEYACRAGTTTRFYWGDDPNYAEIKDYCWYNDGNVSSFESKEVGQKLPNGLGLYDMSGNLYEWCHDWWQNLYDVETVINPEGPDSGKHRVLRSGYWFGTAQASRSAARYYSLPQDQTNYSGFRPVCFSSPMSTPTPIPTPQTKETEIITIPLEGIPGGAKPLEMVYIEPGTFIMGSSSGEHGQSSGEIQHQVTLTKGFYMGKHEVTQAQWQAVMGNNPSEWKGDNLPVEKVLWDDCQTFIQKMNQLYPEYTFRLPTEAEWEYACRAGTTTRFYWGDDLDESEIDQYAWYFSNSVGRTHEVGLKIPNWFGLFDMIGNVWEWCEDWHGEYPSIHVVDPKGAAIGSSRVRRGGSWCSSVWHCHSAYRYQSRSDGGYDTVGFRLVLSHISEPTDTPFPTPAEQGTPTPDPTPTPTLTPTLTPLTGFKEFYVDFDNADITSLRDIGIITYDESDKDALVATGRVLSFNSVIPWRIDSNLSSSEPNSIANNDKFILSYDNSQTSILEIAQTFKTDGVEAPTLAFEIAFAFEPFIFDNFTGELDTETDFMVVEVSCDGGPFQTFPGIGDEIFEGFYMKDNFKEDLTKSHFQYIKAALPKCQELRIAFRFQSDDIGTERGAYIDNIQVYDAEQQTGAPRIRIVSSVNEDAFYADLLGETFISGSFLLPAEKVLFSYDAGSMEVPFIVDGEAIIATLPPITDITENTQATLQVVRDTGETSNLYLITILPAPKPTIKTLSPSLFYKNGSNSIITIIGSNYRYSDTAHQGSIVIMDLGNGDPLVFDDPADFIERKHDRIVLDIPQLKEQELDSMVTLFIRNEPSQQTSNGMKILIADGDGAVQVDEFEIENNNENFVIADGSDIAFQRDQAVTFVWLGAGFDNKNIININIGGLPFVTSGEIDPNTITIPYEEDDLKLYFDYFKDPFAGEQEIRLEIAPMVLCATDYTAGDVTAEIRIGNGVPVVTTFTIADAIAPVIYSRPEVDYSSQTLVSTFTEKIYIYGDNFRGRGTEHTGYESITKFFIYPYQIENPQESDLVELPTMTQFDISIQPGIADNPANEDLFFQTIPANTAVALEVSGYRIRVLNPDSGLYSDSPADIPLIFVSE